MAMMMEGLLCPQHLFAVNHLRGAQVRRIMHGGAAAAAGALLGVCGDVVGSSLEGGDFWSSTTVAGERLLLQWWCPRSSKQWAIDCNNNDNNNNGSWMFGFARQVLVEHICLCILWSVFCPWIHCLDPKSTVRNFFVALAVLHMNVLCLTVIARVSFASTYFARARVSTSYVYVHVSLYCFLLNHSVLWLVGACCM